MGRPRSLSRRQGLRLFLGATAAAGLAMAGCRPREAPRGKPRLGVLQYERGEAPDAARRGFLQALARGGFVPGRDVAVEERFAGASMATCRAQVAELLAAGVDMLVAIGTPPLAAVLALAPADLPVVFCHCSNPWGVGAGTSFTDHRANVVGTVATRPVGDELDLARTITPRLSRVGLLYNPSEANASFEAELLRREAEARTIEVMIEPVAGPVEVPAAARLLASQGVQAFVRVGDYATSAGFAQLAAVGLRQRLPVYSIDPTDITTPGCLAVVGWDAAADGALAGGLAVQVLRGRPPASLPFEPLTQRLLMLNRRTAAAIGVRFPPGLLAEADRLVG